MYKELGILSTVLSAVRLLDDNIPAQTLSVFLAVAKNEGIGIGELATKCGLADSSASRNVAALSDWHWLKRPGLGLVEVRSDRMDVWKKTVWLTPKGKKLAEQLVAILGGDHA